MQYKELTEQIIGCAFCVYNKMGFGFLENIYQKCMMIELYKAGLKAESEKQISVQYESEIVGEFSADILVEDKIIVEPSIAKKKQYSASLKGACMAHNLPASRRGEGVVMLMQVTPN